MRNRITLPIPKVFSFDQRMRWGITPLLVVLVWMENKSWWPPFYSKAEWDDHLNGVRRQRRGIFFGRLYVGIEGIPVLSRVVRATS